MYEFSTECMVFGERSPVFQANCSVKSYCSVGAAHVRPAAVRQTTSCGKAAGRALVGAQRAPTVCKQTRSCGCLPRRGKHCSRPGFVPLNRGPTLTTPQCPAPTTQLGSSSASTRQPFSVGTNRTVVTVAVSGTIVSSPAQPVKSSLSQVSESCQNVRLPSGCNSGSVKRCPQ